jgi:hypothetical protein
MDEGYFLRALRRQLSDLVSEYPQLRDEDRAFSTWVLINFVGADEAAAVDAVVDGGDDKGIDAIHVPEDGERLSLVQAFLTTRATANFPGNKVAKTLGGVDWILNGNLADVHNADFVARAEAFREAYLSTFPTVEIVLAGTCLPPARDGEAEIKKFDEEHNVLKPTFVIETVDIGKLTGLYQRRLKQTTPNVIEFELMERPYERSVNATTSAVASVSGQTIADLVEEHGNAILEVNIRNYLGSVKINRAITETATGDEAPNFLFYNNGITFVCDELSYRGAREAKRVRLRNAQIVNGCQTATSLYEAHLLGRLRHDTEVLVRIIERPDPTFVEKVTRSTNSQNSVKPADLVGSDAVQLDLAQELKARGYYYERRRGDFRAAYKTQESRIKAFGEDWEEKIIRLPVAAQACAAFFTQIPVIAKRNVTYLFLEASERGRYNEVFDSSMTADKVILATTLYRRIQARRRQLEVVGTRRKLLTWVPQADLFVLALFFRAYLDPLQVTSNHYISRLLKEIEKKFDTRYDALVKVIARVVARKQRDDASYNAPTFFKSEAGYLELVEAVARSREALRRI